MTTPLKSQDALDQDQLIRDLLAAGRRQAYLREVDALTAGSRGEKRDAANALVQYGEAALEPLCGALMDPDNRVKVAAARALAELGDPRAIPALAAALREGLSGGTARSHILAAGKAVLRAYSVMVAGGVVSILLDMPLIQCLVLYPPFIVTWNWFVERRDRSLVNQAIVEATVALGEASPTPELRKLLPDLRTLALDRIQQEGTARQAFTKAADRIDTLTANLKSLPVVSEPPASEPSTLPVAVLGGPPKGTDLPRASL